MRLWLLLFALLLCPLAANADESKKLDPAVPFRTDLANPQLPWYQLKPGEFPPQGSEHRADGELVEADFIHRRGQFRAADTGELVDFVLPPFGSVRYLNTDADLRDVPLGTDCVFYLYQDSLGAFTVAATIHDAFTQLAAQGLVYKLDEAKLDQGKLFITRQSLANPEADLGREQLVVSDKTRVWKGDRQVGLRDLAAGEQLLINATGRTATSPGRCTDIWVGLETHRQATDAERKRHVAFVKKRGLPAWVDQVSGKKVTVTLFGDPADTAALFKDEGIVPTQWAAEHRRVDVAVATPELRTYNPPVDRRGGPVQQFETVPTDNYGSSGVRWTIETELLLEGFRAGRIVRLFAHPSWPIEDMPPGENVFSETPNFRADLEEPIQYPYRTDFANEHLAWYQLKPGVFPPFNSHHLVFGELTRIDPLGRAGQFRTDRTGELVDFTLPPFGSVKYLNADADLQDIPLATRCRFFLYQDDRGAFAKAGMVTDEFTRMDQFTRMLCDKLSYRVEAIDLDTGKLVLADQLALVENYKGDNVRPPDVGHGEFAADAQTRVWKGDQKIELRHLAVGDELLLNLTGRTATSRGRCTDVWVGAETLKLATERQQEKHDAALKQHGLPAWIERVEGNDLTIAFFAGPGRSFQTLFHDGPPGGNLNVILVDDQLVPRAADVQAMKYKSHWLIDRNPGVYCFRCVRWVVQPQNPSGVYHPGQIVRVFERSLAGSAFAVTAFRRECPE